MKPSTAFFKAKWVTFRCAWPILKASRRGQIHWPRDIVVYARGYVVCRATCTPVFQIPKCHDFWAMSSSCLAVHFRGCACLSFLKSGLTRLVHLGPTLWALWPVSILYPAARLPGLLSRRSSKQPLSASTRRSSIINFIDDISNDCISYDLKVYEVHSNKISEAPTRLATLRSPRSARRAQQVVNMTRRVSVLVIPGWLNIKARSFLILKATRQVDQPFASPNL